MPHTRFLMIGFFAVTCLILSAPHAPAEEPWTNLGLETYIFQMIADDAEGNVYAAAYSTDLSQPIKEGLFRLSPGSTEWTQVYEKPDPLDGITSIIFPSNGTMLMSVRGQGVYRSTDQGDSWTTTTLIVKSINKMIIRPSGKIFAVGYSQYYVSSDLGMTWQSYSPAVLTGEQINLLGGHDGIYIGNNKELYKSEDEGATWIKIYSVASDSDEFIIQMEVSSNGIIYLVRANSWSSSEILMRSTDFGNTWQDIMGGYGLQFTLSPIDDLYAINWTHQTIQRSTDNGENWTNEFNEAPFFDDPDISVHTLFISPRGTLYISSLAGVYRYGLKVPVEISDFFVE